jgi:hypothetical protein
MSQEQAMTPLFALFQIVLCKESISRMSDANRLSQDLVSAKPDGNEAESIQNQGQIIASASRDHHHQTTEEARRTRNNLLSAEYQLSSRPKVRLVSAMQWGYHAFRGMSVFALIEP